MHNRGVIELLLTEHPEVEATLKAIIEAAPPADRPQLQQQFNDHKTRSRRAA